MERQSLETAFSMGPARQPRMSDERAMQEPHSIYLQLLPIETDSFYQILETVFNVFSTLTAQYLNSGILP